MKKSKKEADLKEHKKQSVREMEKKYNYRNEESLTELDPLFSIFFIMTIFQFECKFSFWSLTFCCCFFCKKKERKRGKGGKGRERKFTHWLGFVPSGPVDRHTNGIDEMLFLWPEFHLKTAIPRIPSVFCKTEGLLNFPYMGLAFVIVVFLLVALG